MSRVYATGSDVNGTPLCAYNGCRGCADCRR